ncbi:MAG TPA: LCP family protein [Acidimicrobiia bacterium]|nr:LCP family protein [Acidimicrobiia bacterium]
MTRSFARVLLKRFAAALAVAFPLVVAGVIAVNMFIDRKIDEIPRVKVNTAQNTDAGRPANFLLIGSDTRAQVQTPEEKAAFGDASQEGGQRSDTLMVIHVDPEQKSGYLVSFPRDLVVNVPGIGQSKLNAAFNAGPQRVVDTLQQNFDIPIHHYLEVDFQSFKGIVDAMGGVPVYIDAPSRDSHSGFEFIPFNFHPGCYTLDGSNALNYVRSRGMEQYIDGRWQTDPRGDLGRIDRQQQFMKRLATEAFRKSVNSPRTALDIADETIPKLKADEGLGTGDIKKLITSFRRVDPNDPNSLQMVTFPTVPGPQSSRLGAILQAKQPDAEAVLARLRQFGPPPQVQNGPKPSEIRVRVLNGSGQNGIASRTGTELQQQGFVNVGVGNQSRVSMTEVHYRPGSIEKARVVQSYLGGVGKVVEDKSVVEADVALVLGPDFRAVTAPANAAPPDTAAAPTTAPAAPAPSAPAKGKGKAPVPPPDPTQC